MTNLKKIKIKSDRKSFERKKLVEALGLDGLENKLFFTF